MKSSLPISNLHRITLLMAVWINLFVLVLIFNNRDADALIIPKLLKSFAIIYILGLTNILAIYLIQKKYEHVFKKPERVRYIFSTLLSLAVFLVLSIALENIGADDKELVGQQKVNALILVFVIFHMLTVVLHDQVILQHSKAQAELENMQLKAAISEASNFQLRQQIHPHFLFNSLTILKSIYKKDAVKGEFYLTRLSNFLRASFSDHSSRITSLQTELTLCTDYMDMQKIRFGDAIHYDVNVSEQAQIKYVPFFSIQVLLENAIKHNAMTEANPLKIIVFESGSFITVKNNLQPKANKEDSTGQGLANLAERYRLLSGDRIIITQDQGTFSATIKMYENEDSYH
ncbi:sensor histidine kinase [Dyadobacter psychrotolerans]|nr:histidine kinase [Dyadobacter psychrotolerans]